MNKAEKVLRELEAAAEKHFMPYIGPVKAKVVEEIVSGLKPRFVVEVGTLHGYSAIVIAGAMPADGKLLTIEIDAGSAEIARKNIEKAGFAGRVKVVVGDALEVLPGIEGEIDLLFLDATKEEYLSYLKSVEAGLKKGGIVLADNAGIFADAMKDFLDYVRNSGKYKSRTIKTKLEFRKEEDAIEVSEKL